MKYMVAILIVASMVYSKKLEFGKGVTILTSKNIMSDFIAPSTKMLDWDGDSKKDLLVGTLEVNMQNGKLSARIRFYKNIGTNSSPKIDQDKFSYVQTTDGKNLEAYSW